MKKIIHLSDLHVGYAHCQTHLNRVVTKLIFLKEPASDYVVIITGDLVEDATHEGLYEAALLEVTRLRAAGFQTLICPGNHDYGNGTHGDKLLVSKFKKTFLDDPFTAFPKLDIIGQTAFIGLDTMAEELNWYDQFFAQGQLGDRQLGDLAALLAKPRVLACDHRVIYMHHHPFHPRPLHALKDCAKLGEVISGRIDCLLYGHNHDGDSASGKWSIPRCYDAGSSSRKNFGNPDKKSPLRVMDLSRDPRDDYDLGNPGLSD